MDNQIISPPPYPVYPIKRMSYGKKCFLMGLQCLLLMIGALIIYGLIYSRQSTSRVVASEITERWGGKVYFNGVKAVPYNVSNNVVVPEDFKCDVDVTTQSLHRGIYEAEVFDADIKVTALFLKTKIRKGLGDKVYLYLGMPQSQIEKLNPVKIAGKAYEWKVIRDSLMVSLDLDALPEKFDVETSFSTRGSGGIYVAQVGEKTNIKINGKAPNPSFQGESLPVARSVEHNSRFSASWEDRGRSHNHRSRIGRYVGSVEDEYNDYVSEAAPTYEGYDDEVVEVIEVEDWGTESSDYVGTQFLVGVDRYQKVARSLKYSFIIILLTYIAVLAVEILRKRPIPLLNYFLIGVSLIIFYTLLLSFAELMAFWVAYLIASVMTIALVSGYMGMIVRSKATGIAICVLLSLYYGACYAMLSSTYALLIGSLLLFAAIALLMYVTLKIRPAGIR